MALRVITSEEEARTLENRELTAEEIQAWDDYLVEFAEWKASCEELPLAVLDSSKEKFNASR